MDQLHRQEPRDPQQGKRDQDLKLLAAYAPVLRFSAGEKFYPMAVEDYIEACPKLYAGKDYEKDWQSDERATERIRDLLKSFDAQKPLNLHLIHREFEPYYAPKIVLTVILAFLVFVIIVGVGWLASNQAGFYLNAFEWGKILLLAVAIVPYPFISADSKVHFALVLNVFGWFFFGTAYAVGLGILGLVLLLGFWMVYGTFWLAFRLVFRHGLADPSEAEVWHVFALIEVILAADVAGRMPHLLNPHIPDISLVSAVAVAVFYAALWLGQKINPHPNPILKEKKAIWILAAIVVLIGVVVGMGAQFNFWDHEQTYLMIISLASVALLWYALDPLPVTRPGPLVNNHRETILGWDSRVLLFISLAFLLFAGASYIYMIYQPVGMEQIITGLVIYLGMVGFNFIVTLGILGPSAFSYWLDFQSGMDDTDVEAAKVKYDEILRACDPVVLSQPYRESLKGRQKPRAAAEKHHPYTCYGRVCEENTWVILLYNYFYAFNDWRSTAQGMNNHEGDWEAVAVFLPQRPVFTPDSCQWVEPFGIAYSQHYNGEFRYWEDVVRVKHLDSGADRDLYHPVVYVALGSHANYPEPAVIPPSVQFGGATRKMVARLETFTQNFRQKAGIAQKQAEMNSMAMKQINNPATPPLKNRADKADTLQGGDLLPGALEYAAGDGMRIGYASFNTDFRDEFRGYAANLPVNIPHGMDFDPETKKPAQLADWQICLIDDETPWVCYPGLWGRFVNMEGENGPQGPKWEKFNQRRLRWGGAEGGPYAGYFLVWLHLLLLDICLDGAAETRLRRRALQNLSAKEANDERL